MACQWVNPSHSACKPMAMSLSRGLIRTEGSVVASLQAVCNGAQVHGPRNDRVVAGRLLFRDRLREQRPGFTPHQAPHHFQRCSRLSCVQPLSCTASGQEMRLRHFACTEPGRRTLGIDPLVHHCNPEPLLTLSSVKASSHVHQPQILNPELQNPY